MSSERPQAPLPRTYDTLAAVLSYLVPGLGQLYQGRVGKGILFLVCIYTLFFYGLYLGTSTVNAGEERVSVSTAVYIPDTVENRVVSPDPMTRFVNSLDDLRVNLYNRPQFLGQFWAGVVAWPAMIQYATHNRTGSNQNEEDLTRARRDLANAVRENQPAQAFREKAEELVQSPNHRHPWLGQFQREPTPNLLYLATNASDKRLELGWVFTVIAGVLNIMVIYDALAGPGLLLSPPDSTKPAT
jgi:hypothetical protein